MKEEEKKNEIFVKCFECFHVALNQIVCLHLRRENRLCFISSHFQFNIVSFQFGSYCFHCWLFGICTRKCTPKTMKIIKFKWIMTTVARHFSFAIFMVHADCSQSGILNLIDLWRSFRSAKWAIDQENRPIGWKRPQICTHSLITTSQSLISVRKNGKHRPPPHSLWYTSYGPISVHLPSSVSRENRSIFSHHRDVRQPESQRVKLQTLHLLRRKPQKISKHECQRTFFNTRACGAG